MSQTTISKPFRSLLRYARGHQSAILQGTLYSVSNKLFDLAPPILIGAAVDVVVSKENSFLSGLGVEEVAAQLWLLAGLTLVIWGLESFFEYLAALAWRNVAQSVQHDLRVDAFDHIQKLELAYFEDRSTGELMSILNDDVNQLERFLDIGAHEILLLLTTILVVGGMFVYLVPSLAWMALVPMPFIALGSLRFQSLIAPKYAAVRGQAGIVNGLLANSLGGIATVKSFTAESFETERVRAVSEEYKEKNFDAISMSAKFVPLIRMVIVLGFSAIMVYGGQLAASGELNVGAYSILVFMTQRLLWPLTRLSTTLDLYHRAMASTARIFSVLQRQPEIVDSASTTALSHAEGAISCQNVSFSYANNIPCIQNLSLDIAAGQTVGIVGATGSGKTTLVKLLLRFYDVDTGSITLDGIDIRQLSQQQLRSAVGLVSQDVFLIDGTVRENIEYARPGASDEEIQRAARIAEADQFIASLPQGYATLVGERGQKLSGGQRQRISIARAVLKDSPVLVLDEATSSVDNETEAAIQRAMYKIAHSRTLVVIAHRLSTVRHADTIFVLEHGQLKESGTHDELLRLDGVYSSLWKVQTGELRDSEEEPMHAKNSQVQR